MCENRNKWILGVICTSFWPNFVRHDSWQRIMMNITLAIYSLMGPRPSHSAGVSPPSGVTRSSFEFSIKLQSGSPICHLCRENSSCGRPRVFIWSRLPSVIHSETLNYMLQVWTQTFINAIKNVGLYWQAPIDWQEYLPFCKLHKSSFFVMERISWTNII